MLVRAALIALPLALLSCDSDADAGGSTAPAREAAGSAKSGGSATSGESAAPPAEAAPAKRTAPPANPAEKVNLNTATAAEFMTIPNVGKRMAHEFDEYRPWVSVQQFRKEIGKYVEPEKVAEFEKWVFVPVDPAACDAETLQQLPGVDATIAEGLVAGRPYTTREDFTKALEAKVGAEAAGHAAAMLAP